LFFICRERPCRTLKNGVNDPTAKIRDQPLVGRAFDQVLGNVLLKENPARWTGFYEMSFRELIMHSLSLSLLQSLLQQFPSAPGNSAKTPSCLMRGVMTNF
jgi:hypothetical protein